MTDDLRHYRKAALRELQALAEAAEPGALDLALDTAVRAAKGLPERPEGADPYVRLFPPPPDPLPHEALAALIGEAKAREWGEGLNAALKRYGITAPLEVAHFLAQLLHESGGFRYLSEIWGPTEAQVRYEGRADLGNTEPGDGYRYRGRGLIQLTGRHNYRRAGAALGLPLEEHPEIVATPVVAALTAAWYWSSRGLGKRALADDLLGVTKGVNGGTNGLADREKWLGRAKAALGLDDAAEEGDE